MKIGNLEKLLSQAVRANPGRLPMALLTAGGPLAGQAPREFVDAASAVEGRQLRTFGKQVAATSREWF